VNGVAAERGPAHAGLLLAWLAVAVVLTVLLHAARLDTPFADPHAWAEAHFATLARNYAGDAPAIVPVQNNPPHGTPADFYPRWPPLFFASLGICLRLFGDGEAVARAFMLAILLGNATAIFVLVRRMAGTRAAAFGALGFLVLPVTITYGGKVLLVHVVLFWTMWALAGFERATRGDKIARGWAVAGALCLLAAVFTSWEAVLPWPALFLAGRLLRRPAVARLAGIYTVVAGASAVMVPLAYGLSVPTVASDLFEIVAYRAGLRPTLPDPNLHQMPPAPETFAWHRVPVEYAKRLAMLGTAAAVSVGACLVHVFSRRPERRTLVLMVGLFAPFLLWFVIMMNHATVHEYQMALAAPPAAAALGLALGWLLERLSGAPVARRTLTLVLPPLLLLPLAQESLAKPAEPPHPLVGFATAIEEATPEGAVVLVPEESFLVTYYSRRHVIRSVAGDADVAAALANVERLYAMRPPVYLALRPAGRAAFAGTLRAATVRAGSPTLLLVELKSTRGR